MLDLKTIREYREMKRAYGMTMIQDVYRESGADLEIFISMVADRTDRTVEDVRNFVERSQLDKKYFWVNRSSVQESRQGRPKSFEMLDWDKDSGDEYPSMGPVKVTKRGYKKMPYSEFLERFYGKSKES